MGGTFSLKIKAALFFCLLVLLGKSALAVEASSCIGSPISTKKANLSCLRDQIQSRAIKDEFKRLADRRNGCVACSDEFLGEKNFSPLFDLRFLTLKLEENAFGGYFSYIMFKESPKRIYRLWLYEVDINDFRIREFKSIKPEVNIVKILTALKASDYDQFWF